MLYLFHSEWTKPRTEAMSDKHIQDTQFIASLVLDNTVGRHPNPDIEHERKVAIYDLVDSNFFSPVGASPGPYNVCLRVVDNRLLFDLEDGSGSKVESISIPMSPFRSLLKDYARVCEAYMEAIRAAAPARIEAIDMGRRGLHDEGSEILRETLKDKVVVDDKTARRLFTVLYVFQMRV